MIVEIENTISSDVLDGVNKILGIALTNNNLDGCYELIKKQLKLDNISSQKMKNVKVGRGGSHIWVSYLNGERILKIVD